MTANPLDRDQMLNGAASFIMDALRHHGIEAIPVLAPNGKALKVDGKGLLNLENLADQMIQLPVSDWEDHLERWAQFAIDTARPVDVSQLDTETLASMIRSRVISRKDADRQNYAQDLTDDLVEVLCLDYPNRVLLISDESATKLQIPLTQLFSFARANTEKEPIDECFVEDGIQFATGESLFIASKIVNMPALLAQLDINAPDGLLFGIPNRSLFIYKIPNDFTDIIDMANMINTFTPEAGYENPGGLISSAVYYWAPDGSIESMMGDYEIIIDRANHENVAVENMTRESTLVIRPSGEFARRFMKD